MSPVGASLEIRIMKLFLLLFAPLITEAGKSTPDIVRDKRIKWIVPAGVSAGQVNDNSDGSCSYVTSKVDLSGKTHYPEIIVDLQPYVDITLQRVDLTSVAILISGSRDMSAEIVVVDVTTSTSCGVVKLSLNKMINVPCDAVGRFLKIKFFGDELSLCTVEAQGFFIQPRTPALGRPCKLSSTLAGSVCRNALDQCTSPAVANCASTEEGDLTPYFRVDFEEHVYVRSVKIQNRDIFKHRLSGVMVVVSTEYSSVVCAPAVTIDKQDVVEIFCGVPDPLTDWGATPKEKLPIGRYVEIHKGSEHLTLCEVDFDVESLVPQCLTPAPNLYFTFNRLDKLERGISYYVNDSVTLVDGRKGLAVRFNAANERIVIDANDVSNCFLDLVSERCPVNNETYSFWYRFDYQGAMGSREFTCALTTIASDSSNVLKAVASVCVSPGYDQSDTYLQYRGIQGLTEMVYVCRLAAVSPDDRWHLVFINQSFNTTRVWHDGREMTCNLDSTTSIAEDRPRTVVEHWLGPREKADVLPFYMDDFIALPKTSEYSRCYWYIRHPEVLWDCNSYNTPDFLDEDPPAPVVWLDMDSVKSPARGTYFTFPGGGLRTTTGKVKYAWDLSHAADTSDQIEKPEPFVTLTRSLNPLLPPCFGLFADEQHCKKKIDNEYSVWVKTDHDFGLERVFLETVSVALGDDEPLFRWWMERTAGGDNYRMLLQVLLEGQRWRMQCIDKLDRLKPGGPVGWHNFRLFLRTHKVPLYYLMYINGVSMDCVNRPPVDVSYDPAVVNGDIHRIGSVTGGLASKQITLDEFKYHDTQIFYTFDGRHYVDGTPEQNCKGRCGEYKPGAPCQCDPNCPCRGDCCRGYTPCLDSCGGRCGRTVELEFTCSCDSSCLFNSTCCDDFYKHCSGGCYGRCGDAGNDSVCSCKSDCHVNNDCCNDYHDLCEPKNLCQLNPCHNHGTCLSDGFSVTCLCPNGFVGEYCQKEVNECLQEQCDPFGTRYCEDQINGFTCACRKGYTGRLCDRQLVECGPDEFYCQDELRCVPASFRCDGVKNCSRGEDELDCDGTCWQYGRYHWGCDDETRCVPGELVCDASTDCLDGTDEHQCSQQEAGGLRALPNAAGRLYTPLGGRPIPEKLGVIDKD